MSVVNVTKMWSKNGGSLSSRLLSSIDQVWSNTEGYQVLTTAGTQEDAVVAASGIPRIGDQHSTGINSYCEKVDPQQISPIFWTVTVSYRGIVNDSSVEVEWSDSTSTEPIDRDINGYAIVTANGEPVDGLSMDISDQVVVIRRKFASINTASIGAYRRSTNSDTYLGWAPGTARLIGFSAKNKFAYGGLAEAWDVTARIQFREAYANTTPAQAWYKRWRHEGLWLKNPNGGLPIRAIDGQSQPVSKPVLLKLDGTQETNPNAAYFFHTQVYGSLPYSALGLI
tara:strand:+ start:631 stop:1479 length:849 start_codon:yes stop_codon:yes gene_type:complete